MNFSNALNKHGFIGCLKLIPNWLRQRSKQYELVKKLRKARLETEDFYIVKDIQ